MEILILGILVGLIPGYIAQTKGRSFVLWWIYGALIFIVALPHSLIMKPLPGSEAAAKKDALLRASVGLAPVHQAAVDFVADGVVNGAPYKTEPDGVVAMINGRMIKFKNLADLSAMVSASQPSSGGNS